MLSRYINLFIYGRNTTSKLILFIYKFENNLDKIVTPYVRHNLSNKNHKKFTGGSNEKYKNKTYLFQR